MRLTVCHPQHDALQHRLHLQHRHTAKHLQTNKSKSKMKSMENRSEGFGITGH